MAVLIGDEGLRFFATIVKPGGERLHRETDDRVEFLFWIDAHATAEDDLTVTTEATGSAARNMLAGLRFGALKKLESLS